MRKPRYRWIIWDRDHPYSDEVLYSTKEGAERAMSEQAYGMSEACELIVQHEQLGEEVPKEHRVTYWYYTRAGGSIRQTREVVLVARSELLFPFAALLVISSAIWVLCTWLLT